MSSTSASIAAPSAERERPQKTATTIGYFLAFITLGMLSASLGPTITGLAAHTGSRLSEISYLFTARSLGYLLGSILAGRMYDRLPGHPIMVSMLFIVAALFVSIPIIPTLWILLMIMVLVGICESSIDVGGNTLLVWLHQPNVGPYMNGLHFFFGVGSFLAPIVIAQLVLFSGGITWAYWALALVFVPVAIWFMRLPSPTPQAKPDRPEGRKGNILLIFLLALFAFLYVGAEVGYGGWVFTYAVRLNLANETFAAYLTSAFWGSLTLGRLLFIPLAARLRPNVILLIDLIGMLIGLLIVIFFPAPLASIWVGTFLIGMSMASFFPTLITFAESRMQISSTITSLIFIGSSLGGMTTPWLIGQLFETAGPPVVMQLIMLNIILALVLFAGMAAFTAKAVRKSPAS
jgi:fucose permease